MNMITFITVKNILKGICENLRIGGDGLAFDFGPLDRFNAEAARPYPICFLDSNSLIIKYSFNNPERPDEMEMSFNWFIFQRWVVDESEHERQIEQASQCELIGRAILFELIKLGRCTPYMNIVNADGSYQDRIFDDNLVGVAYETSIKTTMTKDPDISCETGFDVCLLLNNNC